LPDLYYLAGCNVHLRHDSCARRWYLNRRFVSFQFQQRLVFRDRLPLLNEHAYNLSFVDAFSQIR